MKVILCLVVLGTLQSAQVGAILPPGPQPPQIVPASTTKKPDSSTKSTVIVTPKSIGRSHSDVLEELVESFRARSILDRSERSHLVHTALKAYAVNSQASVLSFLATEKTKGNSDVEVTPLWINNQIIVRNASPNLIQSLKSRPDVEKVQPNQVYSIGEGAMVMMQNMNITAQWGVDAIRARHVEEGGGGNGTNTTNTTTTSTTTPRAREYEILGARRTFNGAGVVVGIIDSGVNPNHEALRAGFRRQYGWFDACKSKSQDPFDDHGHGTHVTGTIVGRTNGIGVAPGAQFISCKACDKSGCEHADLCLCGQFMACPENPMGNNGQKCASSPAVVSNSWGGRGGNPNYETIIEAWRAIGIIPIYAAGNSGPLCTTFASPAESTKVIAVGSVDEGAKLSRFSSRGPCMVGLHQKPEVVAPGGEVVSASHNHTNMYVKMSGTSMACPHVSGVVAIMLSRHPNLDFEQVRDRLQKSCSPVDSTGLFPWLPATAITQNCGGKNQNEYPNYQSGYGMVNAVKACE